MHDRVVNNITPKTAKVAFNLIDNFKASMNVEKPPSNNKMFGNKLKNYAASYRVGSQASLLHVGLTIYHGPLIWNYKEMQHPKREQAYT